MEKFETPHTAEHGHEEKHSFDTKAIWRTFWILLVITCIELIVGMFIAPHFHSLKLMFNILYIIFTAAKAFYIIAEFMHLRHEIKNMIMTIAIPALLFIWFIAAFLWDGNSYKNLRNDYDRHHKEQSTVPVEKKAAGHGEHAEESHKPESVH
ncbi:cytochrome C oxidase subunit IV family protein [Pseudoflavitalea sp. X16]|uniref:cytochrome C oxidase subunit IV family protein n=1 Tax=Paraflavitalea devenefica TaxID=2716334 RepID=UPI0014219F11|nr:cytochrome C oxidase subunit IV family protein [Paraflavitalea devenefica]NII24628.1 cytochrome C oxidase subunit IV family protein [Paraflavitalea devenefica]